MNKLNTEYFAKTYQGETGYRELIKNLLDVGVLNSDRTKVGRQKLFSQKVIFDLQDGFPFHSTRSCPFSFAFKEYQAFLNGISDIHNKLKQEGINFWEGNTTREFLDSVGLTYVQEGNFGKAYGFQLLNFNGDFDLETQKAVPNSGINQMKRAFDSLKNDPFSSRIYTTMWNPSQLHEMALPPCWHSHQWFVVEYNNELFINLEVSARAADVLFGFPFNSQQYAYLLTAFAKALNMKPALLVCEMVDTHLYQNQIKYAEELLSREFSTSRCDLVIKKDIKSFEDIADLTMDDLEIIMPDNYVNKSPFITKRPQMAV